MAVRFFFLFLLLMTIEATAQKTTTIIYASSLSKLMVVVNDSVCFRTTVETSHGKYKTRLPLGSGFQSHDTYINRNNNTVISQSHPRNEKRFLITDTLTQVNWVIGEGEKKILGHPCKRAVAQVGNSVVTIWFTNHLPDSHNPLEMAVPGAVLEYYFDASDRAFTAISIESSAHVIVEPTKGKRITKEEFSKKVKKRSPVITLSR